MLNKTNDYKLNNKGFTLIEMLAVVAIMAIIGLLVVPGALGTINKSTEATYQILVKDITIAGILLYDEIDYSKIELYHYTLESGQTSNKIKIEHDENNNEIININLQTLVSNGLLSSTNNTNKNENKNNKIIINPKTKEDIGKCQITIIKKIDKDNNYVTSYEIKNNSINNTSCPTDKEYQEALN